MLDYFDYEEYSYGQTKQWECSLNKIEEWANKLYQTYPQVDATTINTVVSEAAQLKVSSFEEIEKLLHNGI